MHWPAHMYHVESLLLLFRVWGLFHAKTNIDLIHYISVQIGHVEQSKLLLELEPNSIAETAQLGPHCKYQ